MSDKFTNTKNDEVIHTPISLYSPHVNFAARSPSIIPTPIYNDTNSVISLPTAIDTTASKISSPVISLSESSKSPVFSKSIDDDFSLDDSELPNKEDIDGSVIQQSGVKRSYSAYTSNFIGRRKQGFIPLNDQEDEKEQNSIKSNQGPENIHSESLPELLPDSQQRLYPKAMETEYYDSIPIESSGKYNVKSYRILFDEDIDESEKRFPIREVPKERGVVYKILFGPSKYPIFTWVSAVCMLCVFIYEIARNNALSGNWIQTDPFNPMVGPNYMVLVNLGSRFSPCMRDLSNYTSTTIFHQCYANYDATCTLEQACSFEGFNGKPPNQTFRFFTPIFLHAGFIHIVVNLISHLQFGSDIERSMGVLRYMVLYLGSALWGFILSAVFSSPITSSMGCSGAIFGLLGYSIIKLFFEWSNVTKPVLQLIKIIFGAAVSIVLGMLPGIDNFAHVGGFVMGLLLSFLVFPGNPYASHSRRLAIGILKCAILCIVIVLFAVLLHVFYSNADIGSICPKCKYISCIPVNGWCDNK